MSSHFSANQYEDAFNPKKLKNWTVPRKHKERPSTLDGFTQIIATDRGHLKHSIPRSKESPWGTFMGTWDMPRNIPPARPSYTARSNRAAVNLKSFKESSPLNNAVNGYKEFVPNKTPLAEKQMSPSPVNSPVVVNAPQPSTGGPEKVCSQAGSQRAKTPPRSATPRLASPTDNELRELVSVRLRSPRSKPTTPSSDRPISKQSARSYKSFHSKAIEAC